MRRPILLLFLTIVSLVSCLEHPETCDGENEEYNNCGNIRPVRCGSDESDNNCITSCESGCFCKEGFIREKDGDKCIPIADCSDLPERHSDTCCPSLIHLNDEGLANSDRYYNKTVAAGKTVGLGVVKFIQQEDGFVATCECSGAGDTCYIEFYDANRPRNSTIMWNTVDERSHKINGKYPLVTSPLVTCGGNGTNSIKGEAVTHFDCVTYEHKYCRFEMEEERDLEILSTLSGNGSITIGTTKAFPWNGGFRISCECPKGSGDFCSLYVIDTEDEVHDVHSNVTKFPDGSFSVLTSEQITCDENGATLFQIEGKVYTAERYACFAHNNITEDLLNSANGQHFVLLNAFLLMLVALLLA